MAIPSLQNVQWQGGMSGCQLPQGAESQHLCRPCVCNGREAQQLWDAELHGCRIAASWSIRSFNSFGHGGSGVLVAGVGVCDVSCYRDKVGEAGMSHATVPASNTVTYLHDLDTSIYSCRLGMSPGTVARYRYSTRVEADMRQDSPGIVTAVHVPCIHRLTHHTCPCWLHPPA